MSQSIKSNKGQMVIGKLIAACLLGFLLLPVAGSSLAVAAVDPTGMDPCPDQVLAQATRDSSKTAVITGLEAQNSFFQDSLEAEATSPTPQSNLHDLNIYCIDSISGSFSIARALMDGAKWIDNYIDNVITTLLNAPCTYILGAVSAALSTALNAVCIPISLPTFSLSLPSSNGGKSCSGLSLADMVNINIVAAPPLASPLPSNLLSAPMARFIDAMGLNKTGYIGVTNKIKF